MIYIVPKSQRESGSIIKALSGRSSVSSGGIRRLNEDSVCDCQHFVVLTNCPSSDNDG